MDCKVANRLITPFLEHELSVDDTEELLAHVRTCSGCREDLEIYYTVRKGIIGLDNDKFETYDLKHQFESDLKKAEKRVRIERCFGFFHGIIVFAAFLMAVLAGFIQFTRWF